MVNTKCVSPPTTGQRCPALLLRLWGDGIYEIEASPTHVARHQYERLPTTSQRARHRSMVRTIGDHRDGARS